MCCHPTLVFTNYVKMRFDSVRLLEGLLNNFDCYNRLFSKRFTCLFVKISPRLLSVCGSGFFSSWGLVLFSDSRLETRLHYLNQVMQPPSPTDSTNRQFP
jgi:hypothetical protein